MYDFSESKKRICILTLGEKSKDFMIDRIRNIFGQFAVIKGYSYEETLNNNDFKTYIISSDIIITAGEKSYNIAKKFVSTKKIIIAKRTISSENLEELSLLPEGKTVLTINYSYESTIKTIISLKELGLNHLKYIPYWKGCNTDTKDIEIAISTGMIYLCPENIPKKIDIGMRSINYITYVDICVSLNISLEILNRFATEHIKRLVDAYKRINEQKQRIEAININIQSILDDIDKGYLFVDKDHNISAINNYFQKALDMNKEEIIGKSIVKITQKYEEFEKLLNPDLINKNVFIKLNGKQYLGLCLSVMKESGLDYVFIIQESKNKNLNKKISINTAYNGLRAKWSFEDIVGKSQSMIDLVQKAKLMSRSDSTILLTGESGTGKELMAHSIHNESYRKDEAFIAANFAAIPESLVESELFGYEGGAFTGSKKEGNIGLFEKASGGTIFLDEIGDASHHTQKRLLRVLQEKEIMRLGSSKRIFLDVRIIAATNRNLKDMIKKGLFREDLYFRLRVCTLKIPPLRDRKEDINNFIDAFLNKYHINKSMSRDVKKLFLEYDWKGNVRELENIIEYIANISQGSIINLCDLPEYFKNDISDSIIEAYNTDDISDSIIKESYNTNDNDSILDFYSVDVIAFILQIIQQTKEDNLSLGRKKLSQKSFEQGKNLSQGKLRTILYKMTDYGLIIIGKTKQGILITDKGESLLKKLKVDKNK